MLTNILHLIVYTLSALFLLIVILRFLLQLVRADFYNPISQSIVKITMPLLKPLRTVIPGFLGIDFASVVLILLVQAAATVLLALIHGVAGMLNPLMVPVWGLIGALSIISNIFFWCMIISIIGSFVAPFSQHPLLTLANQIIEPLAGPVRKLIPPLGGMLDLSPIVVLLGLRVVDMVIDHLAGLVGVHPQLVLGYF